LLEKVAFLFFNSLALLRRRGPLKKKIFFFLKAAGAGKQKMLPFQARGSRGGTCYAEEGSPMVGEGGGGGIKKNFLFFKRLRGVAGENG
jgi:hypothetical protein